MTDQVSRPPVYPKVDLPAYDFLGFHGCASRCRVRIYERNADEPVIVLTELSDNPGTSVTNLVEQITAEIIMAHFPNLIHVPHAVRVVEHYPNRQPSKRFHDPLFDESFDFVTFASWELCTDQRYRNVPPRVHLGSPNWIRTTRDAVEALIGGAFDG